MSECPNIDRCPLFSEFSLQASLGTWKVRYCTGDFSACERLKLSQARKPVPARMLPNGQHLPAKPGARSD